MGSYSITQLVLQLTSKWPLAISLLIVQDRTLESDIFGMKGDIMKTPVDSSTEETVG